MSASFWIDAVDDPVADGDQTVFVKAYGSGLASDAAALTVLDDGIDTAPPGSVIWIPQGPGPATNGQVENVRRTAGGPVVDDVVGATHTVAAHPTNANILYVGSVNGGVLAHDQRVGGPADLDAFDRQSVRAFDRCPGIRPGGCDVADPDRRDRPLQRLRAGRQCADGADA